MSNQEVVKSIFGRNSKKDNNKVSSLLGKAKPGAQESSLKVPQNGKLVKSFGCGIDIGTSSVKFAQLGKTKTNSIMVNNCGIVEFSKQALKDPKQREIELPIVLAKMVQENQISGKIFISIPGRGAKTMLLNLPTMPENEISEALGWGLRQEAHIDLGEYSYDYIPVEKLGENKKNLQSFFTIAIKKQDVFEIISIFEKLKLKVDTIDIDPLAEMAAINSAGYLGDGDKVNIIISLGNKATYFTVVYKKLPYFMRTLPVTGESFTSSIKRALNVSEDDAEKMRKTSLNAPDIIEKKEESPRNNLGKDLEMQETEYPSAPGGESGVAETPIPAPPEKTKDDLVNEAILENVDTLINSIEHNFKFFSFQVSRSAITKFDKVILVGGGALLKPLAGTLKKRLGIDVEVANPSANMGFSNVILKKYGKEHVEKMMPRLTTAVGLAQRGLDT